MKILAYIPQGKVRGVNRKWLYGADIIKELKRRHPEWTFRLVDGTVPRKQLYKDIDLYIRPTRHDGLPVMIMECKALGISYIWSYDSGQYVEPDVDEWEKRILKLQKLK